ncbi:DMT family transporter [Desulfovibrio sulfodismutans]|uniref:DMT family transporter n=1 Tax=Desulfolutivibrio sulfodismutans TaxID=63561 RepID=A0A7K3NHQ4_9BACT|nr:DMT family transporter [Desulfolutivibrio sulfodismutans]NDY55731.1 DMT family transporter [Desulfolutivibrio sulfodismutans]QLA13750.1 EamA family transporter [Desulfolutivibrio sulfodismutans DSM 3696]
MANRTASALPTLCLAGAVVLWGSSFVAAKQALTAFAPLALVFVRMALAAAVFACARPLLKPSRPAPGDWKWLALLCLFQPCLYFIFESHALTLTTASQAGVISSLVPLLVTVGARVFFAEPLSARTVAGLFLCLAGVAGLSLGAGGEAEAPSPAAGNLLELAAMACAAGYMLVVKHLCARHDTWRLTALQCYAGAVFFLPAALGAPADMWRAANTSAWASAAYLGLGVTIGAFGLYNMAMARMPAGRASMAINLVPPAALVAGVVCRGDTLTPEQMLACAAIAAGVLLGRPGGASKTRFRNKPLPAQGASGAEHVP